MNLCIAIRTVVPGEWVTCHLEGCAREACGAGDVLLPDLSSGYRWLHFIKHLWGRALWYAFLYASYTVIRLTQKIPIQTITLCGDNPNPHFLWPIENSPKHSSVSSLQDASKPEMKMERSPKRAGRTSHVEEAQKEWSGAGKGKRSGLGHRGLLAIFVSTCKTPSGHLRIPVRRRLCKNPGSSGARAGKPSFYH